VKRILTILALVFTIAAPITSHAQDIVNATIGTRPAVTLRTYPSSWQR
jgi:hypothetical protein